MDWLAYIVQLTVLIQKTIYGINLYSLKILFEGFYPKDQ